MKKRMMAFLVAMTVIMSMLAGCNKTPADDTTTKAPADKTTEASNKETDGATEEPTTEAVNRVMEFEYFCSLSDPYTETSPIYDKLMEETGITVNFTWVAKDAFQTILSSRIADKDLPDVIGNLSYNAYAEELIEEGIIVPLTDVLKEKCPNYWRFINETDEMMLKNANDGEIYAFGYILDQPGQYSFAIRGDWLEKLNLEVPETWDQWVNAWRKFKTEDPNGNGKADEIPFFVQGTSGLDNLMPVFGINTNGTYSIYEGEYYYDPEHPRYMEFLDAMRMLFEEGLIPQDYASSKEKIADLSAANLLGGFCEGASTAAQYGKVLGETDENAIYLCTSPIKGPQGDQAIKARSKIQRTVWVTTAALEDGKLDTIFEFFNYVFSDEGIHITNYGIENESYKMVDGKPVLQSPYVDKFAEARKYGIIPSNIPFYFTAEVYDTITYAGKTKDQMDKWTLEGVKAIQELNNDYFYQRPLSYTTEASVEYADLITQQDVLRDKYIYGEISKDEYLNQYEALKNAGLNEVIEQAKEAYERVSGK